MTMTNHRCTRSAAARHVMVLARALVCGEGGLMLPAAITTPVD